MSARTVLLDLHTCLVENSDSYSPTIGYVNFIETRETYRQWMVDIMRQHQEVGGGVVVVTQREDQHQDRTAARLAAVTGWQPDDWYMRPTGQSTKPPETKLAAWRNDIAPKYGDNPADYVAVESNSYTRKMYWEELRILAFDMPRDEGRRYAPQTWRIHPDRGLYFTGKSRLDRPNARDDKVSKPSLF